MMKQLQKKRQDEGFTLIELLIVIVILGILAAIVVFAVGGITDRGNSSACKADLKTFEVASEAFYAKATPAVYAGTYAAISGAGLMRPLDAASLDVTGTIYTSPAGYQITMAGGGSTANTFTAAHGAAFATAGCP